MELVSGGTDTYSLEKKHYYPFLRIVRDFFHLKKEESLWGMKNRYSQYGGVFEKD